MTSNIQPITTVVEKKTRKRISHQCRWPLKWTATGHKRPVQRYQRKVRFKIIVLKAALQVATIERWGSEKLDSQTFQQCAREKEAISNRFVPEWFSWADSPIVERKTACYFGTGGWFFWSTLFPKIPNKSLTERSCISRMKEFQNCMGKWVYSSKVQATTDVWIISSPLTNSILL